MAKNFANAGSTSVFDRVNKINAEKAQVVSLKNVANENLIDYPNNGEDVLSTEDLELSIKELGFTDPIEVTDFGQSEGKFMIVSGHRRRQAGLKCGISSFPCLIRHFNSEDEVANYVLLANCQRNTGKDPLLICRRYKMHTEYLISQGVKNFREVVAKRLGMSVQQASRYEAMSRVISEVWDFVRDDIVGMSSVTPMATFSVQEQGEIYNIMVEILHSGPEHISRDTMNKVISGYREGKKTWKEIADLPRDSGLPLNHDNILNSLDNIGSGYSPSNVNSEHEEAFSDYEDSNEDDNVISDTACDVSDTDNSDGQITDIGKFLDNISNDDSSSESDDIKRGDNVFSNLKKLGSSLNFNYSFKEKANAEETLRLMSALFQEIVDEMYCIAKEFDTIEMCNDLYEDMRDKLNQY